jgi:alkylation response protein AidB-like acyl-CoA dehydrogenase
MNDELLDLADSTPRPKDRNRPASELLAAGKALRDKVLRQAQAQFHRNPDKVDPIAILQAGDVGRIGYLVPIRYGRMLQSPFTFYRGSAAVMAADLAGTPSVGLRLQACGDCHLMNFGGFATPERNILLDINDFDETLPAPW